MKDEYKEFWHSIKFNDERWKNIEIHILKEGGNQIKIEKSHPKYEQDVDEIYFDPSLQDLIAIRDLLDTAIKQKQHE